LNAQLFVPPSKAVINAWETLGNAGWNWKTMESYYAKTYSLKSQVPALIEHRDIAWIKEKHPLPFGPIQVSYPGSLNDPIPKAWSETFRTLGYAMTGDPFSGEGIGAFSCLASIDPAMVERSYAATAYYGPSSDRKNLHTLINCTVHRILIDEADGERRAAGIEMQQEGRMASVKARKEVILAAGALQSPKVLELSGIGDAMLLRSYGVHVQVENRHVGENLQDHMVCGISFEARDDVPTLDDLVRQDPQAIQAAMEEYMTNKTGPLTSIGVSTSAYLPIMEFLSEGGQIQLKALLDMHAPSKSNPTSPGAEVTYRTARSILESKNEGSGGYFALPAQAVLPTDPELKDSPVGPVAGKFITLGTLLSLPLSRGSVHISSSDANQAPIINPSYLTHPLDIEVFARQMQYLETIAASQSFQSILKDGGRRPDPKSYLKDLKAAKDYLHSKAISMWHYVGTCAMLPREKGGVVDEHLTVYGTSNLRIVDASIMPLIPRANPQSTVYAVAERAADLIKAKHGLTTISAPQV
jgi:choline dehydrogenase-like flavoprotein